MCYSARAKTNITVLELSTADFKEIMHNDYKEYLHEISLKKHILLLNRIREIIKSSKAMYQEQELHKFYEAVSKTIIQLYPSANRKILKSIGQQQKLNGRISVSKPNMDCLNIGEVSMDLDLTHLDNLND